MFYDLSDQLPISFFVESPFDPSDTNLGHYLIATWAKVCQAMGQEFEPYLPVVMPSLLATATAKADLSLYGMCMHCFEMLLRQIFL